MRRIQDLPTLAELQARPRATPKPARPKVRAKGRKPKGPTARRRAARARAERPVKDQVRAECVDRDGSCRLATRSKGDVAGLVGPHVCRGRSQWAHLGDHKRARTRGMAPEERHTTAGSLMLCEGAHDQYDRRRKPYLDIDPVTSRGADGPLALKERDK